MYQHDMNAKFNRKESWEKCSMWDLDNGWQAAVQYSVHYGEYVSGLYKDGKGWHASDGFDNPYANDADPVVRKVFKDHLPLPDFARPWIKGGDGPDKNLVRPNFNKIH